MAAPIHHVEVTGSDWKAVKDFYTKVFDLEMQDFPEMNYSSSAGEARPSFGVGTAQGKPYATFYVGVDDVAGTLDTAASHGATVMMPETQIMEGLVIGLFSDPDGNVVGVMKN